MQPHPYESVQFLHSMGETCLFFFRCAFRVHCIQFYCYPFAYCSAGRPWPHLPDWACLHFIDVTLVPVSRHPNLSICVSADINSWSHCLLLPCLELCHRERWCEARYACHILNLSKEKNCSSLLNKVEYDFWGGGRKKLTKKHCFL